MNHAHVPHLSNADLQPAMALAAARKETALAILAVEYEDTETTESSRKCRFHGAKDTRLEDLPSPDNEWEEMKTRHMEAGSCTLARVQPVATRIQSTSLEYQICPAALAGGQKTSPFRLL